MPGLGAPIDADLFEIKVLKRPIVALMESGVYFYTLTAGDFIATRKMLIRK